MVLLDNVVQVFELSQPGTSPEFRVVFHLRDGLRIGWERWLAKFGHGYKWKPCLKAAMMPRIRSEHGKTSETNA
jgi:hypothetical protein